MQTLFAPLMLDFPLYSLRNSIRHDGNTPWLRNNGTKDLNPIKKRYFCGLFERIENKQKLYLLIIRTLSKIYTPVTRRKA